MSASHWLPAHPALLDAVDREGDHEEIAVVARVQDVDRLPSSVRVVTRFGDIVTLRLPRAKLDELAEAEGVHAVEPSRTLRPSLDFLPDQDDADFEDDPASSPTTEAASTYTRRPPGLTATGKSCVVAALDFGLDVAHPAFLRADGTSRVVALWDQRGDASPHSDNRWGYGRIFYKADIDRALRADDPYVALGYHPGDAGGTSGSHGTHVLDTAAGSGGPGMPGVAPEADLIFVHIAHTTRVLGEGNLGDSASLLEALDFVFSEAEGRPTVVNTSLGAHSGPHDGSTLCERGVDAAVSLQPGRAVVNSAGNYQTRKAAAKGRIDPERVETLRFDVPANDPNESEIELWYPQVDRVRARVVGPDGNVMGEVRAGKDGPLLFQGREVGRVFHAERHAESPDRLVDVFLRPRAPGGAWAIELHPERVFDGRYYAWIERDAGLQPTFRAPQLSRTGTTGTICNGVLSVTCGCADPHGSVLEMASFSSSGPTRDMRIKPEVVAPGVRIRAARSAGHNQRPGARYVTKSGTSMAAPHCTGAIALMFETVGRPLSIQDTRALLFSSLDREALPQSAIAGDELHRVGLGYLDLLRVENTAAAWRARTEEAERRESEDSGVTTPAEGPDELADSPAEEVNEVTDETMTPDCATCGQDGAHAGEWDDPVVERSDKRHVILVSGGPGLFDSRDKEHDVSWGNYVTQAVNEGKKGTYDKLGDSVSWLIFKPAYTDRWNDDTKRRDAAGKNEVARIRGKPCGRRTCRSYVDLLEQRGRELGWHLQWIDSKDDFWRYLDSLRGEISAFYYWGHGRDDLWLRIQRNADGDAICPLAHEVIDSASIAAHASLKKKMRETTSSRRHVFNACNSADFAEEWSNQFCVHTRGYEGTILFRGLGVPTRSAGCTLKTFDCSRSASGDELDHGDAGESDLALDLVAAAGRWLLSRPREGDALVRRSPGGWETYSGTLASGHLRPPEEFEAEGIRAERAGPGGYVAVIESTPRGPMTVARRLTDHRGRVVAGQALVRPAEATEVGAERFDRAPPTPLRRRCGFFGPATVASEAQVREAVRLACENERALWLGPAGIVLGEGVAAQFGHLVGYWLARRGTIRPDTLAGLQANATAAGMNYRHFVVAGAGVAAALADAPAVVADLLAGVPGTHTPANLTTLVRSALENALHSRRDNPNRAFWSAVFISSCVRNASLALGLEAMNFGRHIGSDKLLRLAAAHRVYVLRAFQDRAAGRSGTYHAFALNERAPKVGDMVVQDRTAHTPAQVLAFGQIGAVLTHHRGLHVDIVTHVDPGGAFVVTIGGNVGDSVRRRRYPLDAAGHLVSAPAQLYVQDQNNGALPNLPAHSAAQLHSRSTGRIFAVLSPVMECGVIPGQPYHGGIIT